MRLETDLVHCPPPCAAGDKGEFQTNNLVVDGALHTASPSRKLIALDAATGEQLWTFDPLTERGASS